jgi:serpin B
MKDNAMPFYDDVKEVVFDRPFVYCIFDTETSLPIFIGALNSLE